MCVSWNISNSDGIRFFFFIIVLFFFFSAQEGVKYWKGSLKAVESLWLEVSKTQVDTTLINLV